MKIIDAAQQAHIALPRTTLAVCWKLTRQDDQQFFFTEHDQELIVAGDTYLPNSAFSRSAITNKEDLSVDNLEIAGILDDALITDQDMRNGLFDHAEVEFFAVNWESLGDTPIKLRRGRLGELKLTEVGTFFAEQRGLAQQLITQIVESSTSECRAQFGGRRCKVPITVPVWVTGEDLDDERLPVELDVAAPREFRVPGSALVTSWVRPTVRNNREFRVTVPGRTNPVEPTWDTTVGNTTTQPQSGFTAWSSTEIIVVGDVRRATAAPTDRLFIATIAGTTGGAEPTWNTTIDGLTVDGSVTWITYPLPPEFLTEDAFKKEGDVDAAFPFTTTSRVFQVTAIDLVAATGFYNFGLLEWTSGLNLGRLQEVRDWINASGLYVEDTGLPNLDFVQGAGDDTAVRDAGSWIADGFTPGMRMTVSGSPAQNGPYLVNAVTALTLTINGNWPAENLNTTGASLVGILRQITLFEEAFFTIADNDTFLIYPGCQKRLLVDCRDRFDAVANHRGEAYLPGRDARFTTPNARG